MADRGQMAAAACPPRARLALTTPRAGRLEVEDALLPFARALPPPSLLPLARSTEAKPPPHHCPAVLAPAHRSTRASASSCLFAPLPPLKLHYSPLLLVHLAVSRRTKVAATFVTSAATAMSATSPEFEATVVGIARVPLMLLFLPS